MSKSVKSDEFVGFMGGDVVRQNMFNLTKSSGFFFFFFFFFGGGEVIRQNPSDSTNSSKLGEDRGNEVWGKVGLGGGCIPK